MKILCKVTVFVTLIVFAEVHSAAVRLANTPGSQILFRKELRAQAEEDESSYKGNHKLTENILKDVHPISLNAFAEKNDATFHSSASDIPKTISRIRVSRQANIANEDESKFVATTEAFPDDQTTVTNDIIEENVSHQLPDRGEESLKPTSENVTEKVTSVKDDNQNSLFTASDSSALQDYDPELVTDTQNEEIKKEIRTEGQSEDSLPVSKTIEGVENLASLLATTVNGAEIMEEETTEGTPISNGKSEPPSPAFLDPITGINVDYVEKPFDYSDIDEEAPEILSYDINVGASLIAGNVNENNVGVGQVIPVSVPIHEQAQFSVSSTTPVTTTSTIPTAAPTTEISEPQPSFLDTFLNLFVTKEKETEEEPPILPPPPPIRPGIPPPANLMPPPSLNVLPERKTEEEDQEDNVENEVDSDLEHVTKPTIQNEVLTRPSQPTTPSATRNQLPIRRRPAPGTRPFRPSIFAPRPNLPISKPHQISEIKTSETLPDPPVVTPAYNRTIPDGELEPEGPTLPPSLPNLQILQFEAKDALVNRGSPSTESEKSGFRPFGTQPSQNCREGGKVWKNGEIVAKGEDDPCVLCRCYFGKVVCQRLECPKIQKGCHEEKVAKEECCAKIICDKAANVSIVDTLPNFRPLKSEGDDIESTPIRPSAFAHHNRRPPFSSVQNERKPAPGLRNPISLRRPRPSKRPAILQEEKKEEPEDGEVEDKKSRTPPRWPLLPRPNPLRPHLRKPASPPLGERPPFSGPFRTGTRPPFIPPRFTPTKGKPLKKTTKTTTPISSTVTVPTSTSTNDLLSPPSIISEEHIVSLEKSQAQKAEENPLFASIFEELANIEHHSLPKPIHSKPLEDGMIGPLHSNKPFVFPPNIRLPKPLPPSNPQLDAAELLNLVQQEKFNLHQGGISPPFIAEHGQIPKPHFKPLPEIPEAVKAQLPLGNDPILVSGLLELGGCNVYGRMFGVGEKIHDISGKCKACRCTKVGVQCLPFC